MTLIKSFRIISFLEGLSYLYLLFCSVYYKRIQGDEHAIEAPGAVHGVLFLAFCILLFGCLTKEKFNLKFSLAAFVASLIPFGFIWIERCLKNATR